MSDISDRRTDLPPRAVGVPDTGQGLFQKFEVRRTDGSSEPGGKHDGCEYFVLDTDHDPHAPAALAAYANRCEVTHPLLARDLRERYHLNGRTDDDIVTVPILERFDQAKPIGWVKVLRAALPPTPSWCFSLGYEVLQAKRTGITRTEVTDYRLHAVSITSDDEYERVIDREKGRLLTEPTEHVVQALRERAIGIARDVADAFATQRSDGPSTSALLLQLADAMLQEPELLKTIATWHAAALHQVDGPKPVMRKGVRWRPFCVAFDTPDGLFEVDLYAVDWEHAEARLAALKANGRVASELVYREPDRAPAQPQAAQPAARHTWDGVSATERTHARRLLARHCSLELRATLSAHQEEWWRLNREREASEADILQVLAAGLSASRVEPGRVMSDAQSAAAVDALRDAELPLAVPGRARDLARKLREKFEPRIWIADAWTAGMLADFLEQVANAWNRRPAAGMVLSQSGKRSSLLGPVVIDVTARWAGAIQDAEGGWDFSSENWQKFVEALSTEPPLELMTSPGVSAPESVVHPDCIVRGCQEALNCPQGRCAKGEHA